MPYICYYCAEKCDGKPCIVIYPDDEAPAPNSCLIGSASAEWEPVDGLTLLNKFVEEVLSKISIEEIRAGKFEEVASGEASEEADA